MPRATKEPNGQGTGKDRAKIAAFANNPTTATALTGNYTGRGRRKKATKKDLMGRSAPQYKGDHTDNNAGYVRGLEKIQMRERARRSRLGRFTPEQVEQTPFGLVRTQPSRATKKSPGEFSHDQSDRVHYLKTNRPSFESPLELKTKGKPNFQEYAHLAPHLTPELAAVALSEIYATLAEHSDGEEATTRRNRCGALEENYRERFSGDERRTMAMIYGLCVVSESERTDLGKLFRAALGLIATGAMSAEEAFLPDEELSRKPALMQAMAMDEHRWLIAGGQPVSEHGQRLLDEASEASVDLDDDDYDFPDIVEKTVAAGEPARAQRLRESSHVWANHAKLVRDPATDDMNIDDDSNGGAGGKKPKSHPPRSRAPSSAADLPSAAHGVYHSKVRRTTHQYRDQPY